DFSVLPDLTDQDLEKLGIVLGDRRKILRAVAKLETHKSADTVTVGAAAPAGPSLLDTAERRQVTVLFRYATRRVHGNQDYSSARTGVDCGASGTGVMTPRKPGVPVGTTMS